MRLVYFGTPEIAVPPLLALHAAGHQIELVVSRADTRRGRGSSVSPSPVKAAALDLGLAVSDDPTDVLGVTADLGVVVAYGRIITPTLLAHLPMVNLHFSLLPRWRGAAPVERAILAGDERTGVCVMAVDEGLDTGAVYATVEVPIGRSTTAAELREELVHAGTALLVDTLERGLGTPEPQTDQGVTYAHKLGAEDLQLDWTRPLVELWRVIRLGGARTSFRGGAFKVLAAEPVTVEPTTADASPADDPDSAADQPVDQASEPPPGTFVEPTVVATTDGRLRLLRVQPEGRPAMDAAAWANGARPLGDRLGG